MWGEDQLKWYDKVQKARPTHIPHGVNADNIQDHMKRLMPNNWRLEGNVLVGQTDMGELRQTIPTDYILKEVKDGLPVFEKVVLL